MNTHYKGKIADIKIFNRYFNDINEVFENTDDIVLHYDFSSDEGANNIEITTEKIDVIENILPYRREGHMYCLHHVDEGFINGKWAKEATAINEKRFVSEMQQRKIDYKNDGMNSLKYELVSADMFLDNCLMINVKL
jgi:hypothetical protein